MLSTSIKEKLMIHDFYFCNFSLLEYLFDKLWIIYIGLDGYT